MILRIEIHPNWDDLQDRDKAIKGTEAMVKRLNGARILINDQPAKLEVVQGSHRGQTLGDQIVIVGELIT